MKNNSISINLFYHLYYKSGLDIMYKALKKIPDYGLNIFINISHDTIQKEQLYFDIKNKYPKAIIIFSTNVGKDIGAKLALINLSIKLGVNSDYSIFLHDKKSPHTILGEVWREKLFNIIETENISKILSIFEQNNKIGIIAAKEFIANEYDSKNRDFNNTSNHILKDLIQKYNFNLNNYDFVGGTMFWIRAEIIQIFFNKYSPLEIRSTLEKGNVLDHEHGTNTHAWERMLSWIAIDQGYTIKGI